MKKKYKIGNIIAFVFYGRRSSASILFRYLDKNLKINDEEVCQAKTIYRAFSSNATLNDVLMMLEAKSEGFVTANDVEETCLIENTSLWQLQVKTFSGIDGGKVEGSILSLF